MSPIAFVTDQLTIGKNLDHLGLSTPEAEKPPPPGRELLRVAEEGDGWGVPTQRLDAARFGALGRLDAARDPASRRSRRSNCLVVVGGGSRCSRNRCGRR